MYEKRIQRNAHMYACAHVFFIIASLNMYVNKILLETLRARMCMCNLENKF